MSKRISIAEARDQLTELVDAAEPLSARRTKLEAYLREALAPSLKRLPYDDRAAERHAIERARLVGLGRTPSFIDGQIAAIAIVHGLVVVTRNVDHFVAFQDLGVQDWSL